MDCYTAEIKVGTPNPQLISLAIDTGSDIFWMNDAAGSFCKDKANDCDNFGTYTPEDSQSYRQYGDESFTIQYGSGEEVSGSYATDIIDVAGQTFTDIPFGVADSSTSELGIIGLGYSVHLDDSLPAVPTFPEVLLKKKIIKLNAYSLLLNDLTAASGSVLYGGLDIAKIEGSLTTMPVRAPDVIPVGDADLAVTLNAISFGGIRSQFLKAVLDSGTTDCLLPPAFIQSLLDSLEAEHSNDGFYVDCAVLKSTKTVDFEFGSENNVQTFRIPLSQFVFLDPVGEGPSTSTGAEMCGIHLSPIHAENDPVILGDSFLRSVYVVYDLTNNEISIGKAKYTSASNVMEIPEKGVTAMDLGQKIEPIQKPLNSGDDNTIVHGDGTALDLEPNDKSNSGTDETSNNAKNDASNPGNEGSSNNAKDVTFNTGNNDPSNNAKDVAFNSGNDGTLNPGNDDTASEISFLTPDASQGQADSGEA